MEKVVLTGNDLDLDKLWAIAVKRAPVEIDPEADARLEASRKLVYDLVDEDVPVYGFNTGVGWNKDHKIAKEFFEDFVKYTRTEHGFSALKDVRSKEKDDSMESFLFAETFKYYYLLFAPAETLDFDGVVFNTEAHPLRRTW